MAKKAKAPEPEKAIEPESFDWRGVEHWRCPVCGRDSEHEQTIREHIAAEHTRRPHPLAPAAPEESADGEANADQNDDSGAEPDGGRGGHDDGGGHDQP